LVKAIDRFDTTRGHAFASYAVPTILGELKRYFRDSGWSVHVPRGAQEQALKAEEARLQLTGQQGRSPTIPELAQYMELDYEEVLGALQAGQAYDSLSLDAPRPSADRDGQTYGDSLGQDDARIALMDDQVTVAKAIAKLPARQRELLHLRFAEDLTQTEIARRVGVSQMQVSRLLRRSLTQLRTMTEVEGDGAEAIVAGGQSPAP